MAQEFTTFGVGMVDALVNLPPLTIDADRVLQRMGYRDPSQVAPKVKDTFEAIFPKALDLLNPRAAYRLLALDEVDAQQQVLRTPEADFKGGDLIRLFGHAHRLAAFVVTLGPDAEADIQRRAEGNQDLLNAYYIDVIASEALMVMLRQLRGVVQADLRAKGDAGTVTRYWYCPGYGDWDVRDQRPLFGALRLEAQAVGVRLNDYCAMRPRKSYSGLFGIGPAVEKDPWDSDIPWVAR